MSSGLRSSLQSVIPGMPVREQVPMGEYTSFHIGGAVSAVAFPRSAEELEQVQAAAQRLGVRYLVMGNGTNLLFPDEGLEMLVIRTCPDVGAITCPRPGVLRAESGVLLSRLASEALRLGLTGLEFSHGIPGSVGGAVSMNAGAYGGEMAHAVTAVGACGGEKPVYSAGECAFGKRKSRFTDTGETVLWAEFSLTPGDPAAIRAQMEELGARRRASQPLSLPSAGSFFKRPENGYAGYMIQECGLKGLRVGDAAVSEKHAGFLVNLGSATCRDVLTLMEQVQSRVQAQFGVLLEPEVRIVR